MRVLKFSSWTWAISFPTGFTGFPIPKLADSVHFKTYKCGLRRKHSVLMKTAFVNNVVLVKLPFKGDPHELSFRG